MRQNKLDKQTYDKLLSSFIEVKLTDKKNFGKIIRTLARIGIPGKSINGDSRPSLCQSCHILKWKNPERYFIVHFKELFLLDGKESTLTVSDVTRRNRIAAMLEDWGLIEIVSNLSDDDIEGSGDFISIKVIKRSEENQWNLVSKYKSLEKRNSVID